jgi:hypothetical protein
MATAETTIKYKADFEEASREADKYKAKLDKLSESFKKTSERFGVDSRQVKMVSDAIERATTGLAKATRDIERLSAKIAKSEGGSGGTGSSVSGISNKTREDLRIRYERESIKYYKDFNQFYKTSSTIGRGIGGGISGLVTGDLSKFARGFSVIGEHLLQSGMKNLSGAFAMGAMTGKGGIASKVRKGAAGEAAAAEEGGLTGAIEEAVSVGAGLGLARAFAAIPGSLKLLAGGLMIGGALVGGDLAYQSQDVYSRWRRYSRWGVGGQGGFGAASAFEATMGRFVDPGAVMGSMAQAKFDITSPAYTSMMIAGLNPAAYKTQTGLAYANIIEAQAELKRFKARDPQTMLTMAHARGLQYRGFSDEDLISLATGGQDEVVSLYKRGIRHEKEMDISDENVEKYKDLITNVSMLSNDLKAWNATILAGMPILDKFLKTLDNWAKKYGENPDLPSPDATPKTFTVEGGGNFKLPGSDKTVGAPRTIRSRGTGSPPVNINDVPDISKGLTLAADSSGWTGGGNPAVLAYNPVNIGWFGTQTARLGAIGPSRFMDSGHPVAQFANYAAGIKAAEAMILGKYRSGQKTIWDLVAKTWPASGEQGARTPGIAHSISSYMGGFDVHSDLKLDTPEGMRKFLRALVIQEAGPRGAKYIFGGGNHTKPQHISMNDMSHFQMHNRIALNINNPAGANYVIHSGMLGSSYGNFGTA